MRSLLHCFLPFLCKKDINLLADLSFRQQAQFAPFVPFGHSLDIFYQYYTIFFDWNLLSITYNIMNKQRVLAVGDSLTAGTYDTSSDRHPYALRLQPLLGPSYEVTFILIRLLYLWIFMTFLLISIFQFETDDRQWLNSFPFGENSSSSTFTSVFHSLLSPSPFPSPSPSLLRPISIPLFISRLISFWILKSLLCCPPSPSLCCCIVITSRNHVRWTFKVWTVKGQLRWWTDYNGYCPTVGSTPTSSSSAARTTWVQRTSLRICHKYYLRWCLWYIGGISADAIMANLRKMYALAERSADYVVAVTIPPSAVVLRFLLLLLLLLFLFL